MVPEPAADTISGGAGTVTLSKAATEVSAPTLFEITTS
jgi:hypothetical protein